MRSISSRQRRSLLDLILSAEKEEKVDVIEELLKEEEEDESTYGFQTACSLRYGSC